MSDHRAAALAELRASSRRPIAAVVDQHVEDAAALRAIRSVLVRAPHVKLHHLGRLDERLAAALDGIGVAAAFGQRRCAAALDPVGKGPLFAAAAIALRHHDAPALDKLAAIAQALPDAAGALVSAFGWASAAWLQGTVKALLDSPEAGRRELGLSACAAHRVDPGPVLAAALAVPAEAASARALWAAGQLGRADLLPACLRHLDDPRAAHPLLAARAALLIGERERAPARLKALSLAPGPHREPALRLYLKVATPQQSHEVLARLAREDVPKRLLVAGVGIAGDPHHVPWLIEQMNDPQLARAAGESFSLMTGLDMALLDLERDAPDEVAAGPDDDPAHDDVAIDEDDSLPWPDTGRLADWWHAHGPRFVPGVRHFIGAPLSLPQCRSVLRTGFQRQRIAAAEHLCLLRPGGSLFNTAAPAWRQQRELADAVGRSAHGNPSH
jgi:uncharacterized protein (TIGR02270 family)